MDSMRVIFVQPIGATSDVMQQAFELCKQNISTIEWIKESEVVTQNLGSSDFVIFDEFKGECFEELKERQCTRILGPWCLIVCLAEGKRIPNTTWPIYNAAMIDCIISCSHLMKNKKNAIKEKVQLMGGYYVESLMENNTHLVSGSVKSEKYVQAAEAGLKIMLPDWIDDVWEQSWQDVKIHCNDQQFEKYKCPPFHQLTICSTGGKDEQQRQRLKDLITNNGGIFSPQMNLKKTDFLIVIGDAGTTSQKFKAARKAKNIECVTWEWIVDSIEKGYALPSDKYHVKTVTSTPTKGDVIDPNFSVMSAIGGTSMMGTFCNETVLSTISKSVKQTSHELDKIIEDLNVKEAKKAGQYLDGCSVYLAGFETYQKEKLCKIINMSGATRYEDISDRVTHVIVGNPNCAEIRSIKSTSNRSARVSLLWLRDSMKMRRPVEEENYFISDKVEQEKENVKSPICRKALNLLRSNNTIVDETNKNEDEEARIENNEQPEKDYIMQQYLQTSNLLNDETTDTLVNLLKNDPNFHAEPPTLPGFSDTSLTQNSEITEPVNYFKNLKFLIMGDFEANESFELKQLIEQAEGVVLPKTYKGIPDYLVLPTFINTGNQLTAKEVVNDSWITECAQAMKLCEILYYHRPFLLKEKSTPLENCVITTSGYPEFERQFLIFLIETLGGVSQERLARVPSSEKNLYASTHLISREIGGKKYLGALKWGLPVLSIDWLLECGRQGKLVEEEPYLMGESKTRQNSHSTPSKFECISTSCNTITPLKTPLNRLKQTPNNVCSQVTPVSKIMEDAREREILSVSSIEKKHWTGLDTPDTPYGQFLRPNPSPNTRKYWLHYVNQYDDKDFCPRKRRLSTPLSELKRRLWAKLGAKSSNEVPTVTLVDNENETSTTKEVNSSESIFVSTKLKEMELMMASSEVNRRLTRDFQTVLQPETTSKETQPMTIDWDFSEKAETSSSATKSRLKIFMISGVDNDYRLELVKKLEALNAVVSDLSSYDPNSTHLICPKTTKNEKTLSCMAAGKWILHINYVEKSAEAGLFLNEEDFEFGNPKSVNNIPCEKLHRDVENRMQCAYWWRKEIRRRGYGAFNDVRAIIVANKRDALSRVIEAGDGRVIDVNPPFDSPVHATHCLLEARSVTNYNDFAPLAQQGIHCINTIYISDFLHKTPKDISDYYMPSLAHFYKH